MNEEEIVLEPEDVEQEINMEQELAIISAVTSVNGKTGDVVLKTSDLENDSDYQTGSEVESAISEAVADKQDKLTAGSNITIDENNVISATDTTYSAGNGLNLDSQNAFSVDTTVVATQQNLASEVTNRENADNALQAQIDGIAASSDVVDIVGTYADLQDYDTSKLKDNDIIKVLQDSTQNNATTYYRWSTSSETFTLIGQEGPYYTKAAADSQFVPQTRTVNGKALSSNITLNASDVSALSASNIEQTTGSSTSQIMSQKATTDALGTKLNVSDYVVDTQLADSTNPVQNKVINNLIGEMPSDFFSGSATSSATGTEVSFNKALTIKDYKLDGDTFQQTYSGKNLAGFTNNIVAAGCTYTENNGVYTITATVNSPSIRFALAKPIQQGTLAISGSKIKQSGTTISLRGTTGNFINANKAASQLPSTVTPNADAYYVTFFSAIQSGQTLDIDLTDFQIEEGSTATSFEPYVGGTASPNPDYPQNIDVVTGEQTVSVHGKNLLDSLDGFTKAYIDNSGAVIYDLQTPTTNALFDYIVVNPSDTYHFSSSSSTLSRVGIAYFDSSKTFISREQSVSPNSVSFTMPVNCHYVRIWVAKGDGISQSVLEQAKAQFERGSSSTPYEAFAGIQSYTVDLGSTELAKIGNYQDYIYKSGDDWYVHKECEKDVIDGDTEWTKSAYGTNNYSYVTKTPAVIVNSSTPELAASILVKSDCFEGVSFNDRTINQPNITYLTTLGSDSVIFVRNNNFNTASELSTFCANNNPMFYYPVATPTDAKITDSTLIAQLEALLGATCYDGTTILTVSASGSNLPAGLEMSVYNNNLAGIVSNIKNS